MVRRRHLQSKSLLTEAVLHTLTCLIYSTACSRTPASATGGWS